MGAADAYLAEIGAPEDEWHREIATRILQSVRDVPDCARDEQLLRAAAHPVVMAMLRFGLGLWPGAERAEDVTWAAIVAMQRREIAINREAGIDGGLDALNDAVLDWVEDRLGCWEDPSFSSLVRTQVDELLDAGRLGRERAGHGERGHLARHVPPQTGWLMRHPGDHWFRPARDAAEDPTLRTLIDAQIALLADSYDALAAQTPVPQSELMVELVVRSPVPSGWKEPVSTSVVAVETGALSVGDQLGLRRVADPAATRFNGTLVSVHAGERWLVCATGATDGTVIPVHGSRRLAA